MSEAGRKPRDRLRCSHRWLRDDLRGAIQVHRSSPLQGPITSAALAAAEAGLAAREGRWDEAHAGYQRALDAIHASGYRVDEALTGLEWGALAGSRNPDALAAGEAGAAFFNERSAGVVVERYRAAFVPVAEEIPSRPAAENAAASAAAARART